MELTAVLVTTDSSRRGVFFGYTADNLEQAISTGCIKLTGLRNCIYWHQSIGGVFGLAQTGPNAECRIGAKIEGKTLINGVTAIAEVTESAKTAWEEAPCVS